jgi:hypothetical protein
MSRQKIWYSKIINIPVAESGSVASVSADMTKRIMYAKKLILTHEPGFAPEGAPASTRWSVYATSTGGLNIGFNYNDSWTYNASSNWSAVNNWSNGSGSSAGGTAHPWCILRSPVQLSFDENIPNSEKEFYMCQYKGPTGNGSTEMGLTFKYRTPTGNLTNYNSPMYSSYIDGTLASDPYGWGFAAEGSSDKRVLKANYSNWKHTFGVSGLDSVKMLVSMADDGSYIMLLFEQGVTKNMPTTTYGNNISYIEMCLKIPKEYNTGTQDLNATNNIFTVSQPIQPVNPTGSVLNVLKDYPHNIYTPGTANGNSNDASLYCIGGSGISNGFHAAKLASGGTVWGDNQLVKANPAWPLGYGSYRDSISHTSSTTSARSAASFLKTDALSEGVVAFPYYALLGSFVQTTLSGGISNTFNPYPICQIPDIYISTTGLPSGTVISSDGNYWVSVAELLLPVGSDTTLF